MNLFKINEDLQAAIELAEQEEELSREDGQWLFKIIEGLNIDRDAKLENIGRLYKNESALADMIDAEIKALQARKKTHQNKAEWLKEWARAKLVVPSRFSSVAKVSRSISRPSIRCRMI